MNECMKNNIIANMSQQPKLWEIISFIIFKPISVLIFKGCSVHSTWLPLNPRLFRILYVNLYLHGSLMKQILKSYYFQVQSLLIVYKHMSLMFQSLYFNWIYNGLAFLITLQVVMKLLACYIVSRIIPQVLSFSNVTLSY